jgi:hypothetical protein
MIRFFNNRDVLTVFLSKPHKKHCFRRKIFSDDYIVMICRKPKAGRTRTKKTDKNVIQFFSSEYEPDTPQ